MKLYGLKNCDTCKKALKEIKHARKNIEFIDIRESYMSLDLIQDLLDRHSDGVLINRKSITWRNLSHEDRQTPASKLLHAHPTLAITVSSDGPWTSSPRLESHNSLI